MPKRTRTTRRLEVWLKDTSQPLFVLNAQRRLVFFNRGCERLTGWAAPDLLGQKCDYVSEAETHSTAAVLAALAPPPEAWSGKLQQAPVNIPCRESDPVPRVIHFFPLAEEAQDVKAILGIIAEASETATATQVPAVQRLHAELAVLRQAVRRRYGDGSLVGRSQPIRRAFDQLKLAQATTLPVLFVGERGTGKEHLARVLHYQGSSGKKAFVPIDCRIHRDFEQTLSRMREDQQVDVLRAGVIYLDGIHESSIIFQHDLLDWLKRDGQTDGIRILASSTQPLEPLVEAERFSRELYFRLTPLVVTIPPLRDRMEDLQPSAQHFLEELNRDAATQVGGFSDDVWRQLQRYNWPGNLAELNQVVAEARAGCAGSLIQSDHLPFRFRTGVTAQSMEPAQRMKINPLDQVLEQVEREQIELALAECRDNKARAAELLGITRPRLYRRMEILGIVDPSPESQG